MNKHTPGPWDRKGNIVYSPGHRHIASVVENGDYSKNAPSYEPYLDEEDRANMALILAAPDLLAAAKAVRDVLNAAMYPLCVAKLDAAIAKAEGRDQ